MIFKRDEDKDPLKAFSDVLAERLMEQSWPETTDETVDLIRRVEEIRALNPKPRFDPNRFALVMGNLAGILTIVAYEQRHVMRSEGLKQLLKP